MTANPARTGPPNGLTPSPPKWYFHLINSLKNDPFQEVSFLRHRASVLFLFAMYKPSLDEFKAKAKQGNLIPVYKEILADLDTPVSAYLKIREGTHSFLLESVEGGDKWARYCFLGCDPATVIQTKGDTVTVQSPQGRETRSLKGEKPLSVLQDLLAQYQPCLLYTSPSPRDRTRSRMPSSA